MWVRVHATIGVRVRSLHSFLRRREGLFLSWRGMFHFSLKLAFTSGLDFPA